MYKIYATGQEFLDENLNIIRNDPLGTTFMEGNANMISTCNESNYALRIEHHGELLIAIRVENLPFVIYGSELCAAELAKVVAENKLQFGKVIGYYDVLDAFLTAYESHLGGTHKVNLSMDVMYCEKVNPCDIIGVEQATEKDTDEIARLVECFTSEAVGEQPEFSKVLDKVSKQINSYAVFKIDGVIVSMGMCYHDGSLRRISNVYTLPEYRNRGYSKKVVTYLTEQALKGGIPCLHVDQHNPVSNHLYQSIGYVYGKSRYEIIYTPARRN